MSIIKTLPDGSRFIPTVNRFSATFNVPTLGKYNFAVAANTGQELLKLVAGRVYFIERMNFGATVDEGDFLLSIDTLPELILRYQITGERLFTKPFHVVNYIDNQELILFFSTARINDTVLIDFTGILNQVPNFIGINTIQAQVSFNIYEIANQQWIRDFQTSNK